MTCFLVDCGKMLTSERCDPRDGSQMGYLQADTQNGYFQADTQNGKAAKARAESGAKRAGGRSKQPPAIEEAPADTSVVEAEAAAVVAAAAAAAKPKRKRKPPLND